MPGLTVPWVPFAVGLTHTPYRAEYGQVDPTLARRAFAALGRAIPDRRLFAQEYTQHQLAFDYVSPRGFWRLLEVGLMLDRLRAADGTLHDYPDRLRSAKEYLRACTELQAGLLFNRIGFEVERDPRNRGRRGLPPLAGPDWLARQGRYAFPVEVVCPARSEDVRARELLVLRAFVALQMLARPEQGLQLTLHPQVLARPESGRWATEAGVRSAILEALVEFERRGRADSEAGTILPAQLGTPLLSPFGPDEAYEVSRLRSHLEEKAAQLRELSPQKGGNGLPSPGIIVLDTSGDDAIAYRCEAVPEILWEEAWARDVALVIIVVATFPGFVIRIARGRRFDEFRQTIPRNIYVCPAGHHHVDSVGLSRCPARTS